MRFLRVICCSAAMALPAAIASTQEAPPPPASSAPVTIMPDIGGANRFLPLLRRVDVQNAIRLTVNQKSQLADLLSDNKTAVRVSVTAKSGDDPASRQQQVQDQIAAQFKGIEDRIEAALRPEQFDRLVEISLQWKGPMALSDARTADRLKISPEHRAEIMKIAAGYHIEKSKIMMALAQQQTQSSPDGSKQIVMTRINSQELENPTSPAYKKLSALQKEADGKILELLTAEERASWVTAQGSPMTFRRDLPGNRF